MSVFSYDGAEGISAREESYQQARAQHRFRDDPGSYLDGHEVRSMHPVNHLSDAPPN